MTSKIHVSCDTLGTPLRMIVTLGNRNDITQVKELVSGLKASFLLADKGYDGQHTLDMASTAQAIPVIAQRVSAKCRRPFDKYIYKARHIIENFFSKLKQFRRVATRYDKHLQNWFRINCRERY